ncbi:MULTISPECIES: hypothetical protein [Streptomyces]|nr:MULTISPECIES: hypothetical protein [Streptomyces]MDN5385561.1 hypothetical protein [Streptomyces sp. LB8]
MSAVGALMAGGVALGTAGTAAAATPATTPAQASTGLVQGGGCYYGGWWRGHCGGFGGFGGFLPYNYGYGYGYNSGPVVILVR